jgi:cysteine-rich CPCC protein
MLHPCPACGFLVFDQPAGSYDVCPVCDWEDDHVQLRYPGMRGGANRESLRQYQDRILKRFPSDVQEAGEWQRDRSWRPVRDDECATERMPGSGTEYFEAVSEEAPPYYWQRSTGHPE